MILRHPVGTFDHRREVTPLAHPIGDHERGDDERRLTHLEEFVAEHDPARGSRAGDLEACRYRSADKIQHRCLHRHGFSTASVVARIDDAGWPLHAVEPADPCYIL